MRVMRKANIFQRSVRLSKGFQAFWIHRLARQQLSFLRNAAPLPNQCLLSSCRSPRGPKTGRLPFNLLPGLTLRSKPGGRHRTRPTGIPEPWTARPQRSSEGFAETVPEPATPPLPVNAPPAILLAALLPWFNPPARTEICARAILEVAFPSVRRRLVMGVHSGPFSGQGRGRVRVRSSKASIQFAFLLKEGGGRIRKIVSSPSPPLFKFEPDYSSQALCPLFSKLERPFYPQRFRMVRRSKCMAFFAFWG